MLILRSKCANKKDETPVQNILSILTEPARSSSDRTINEYKVRTKENLKISEKRNYKGLLKNFHEMNKWNEQISVQQKGLQPQKFRCHIQIPANFHIRILLFVS